MAKNPKVDDHIARAPEAARPILRKLREIVHGADPGITEEIKWGAPTFMKRGMVCSMHAFKHYVGLWFFKGVKLKDPKRLLAPGVSAHTMKNIKIAHAGEIRPAAYAALVRQAVAFNESGEKIKPPTRPVVVPPALRKALAKNAKAREFFNGLAPSHRREYAGYVAEAKQPETIDRRVIKTIAELSKGRRPHEKYRT